MGWDQNWGGGNGDLIITEIQSPNFVHNSQGWQIRKDGSAEFNNLTIRGTFFGTDFILNSTGLFFYSSTPALGNLILSIVPGTTSVTDPEGNTAQPGVVVGSSASTQIQMFSSSGVGQLLFLLNNVLYGNGVLESAISGGAGQLILNGPKLLTQTDFIGLVLNSAAIGTSANLELIYNDDASSAHEYAFLDASGFNIAAGRVTGTEPGTGTVATPAVAETVHTASLINSWAGSGSGVNGLFYWVNANNELRIVADIQNASATGNSTCFNLPANWRPAVSINVSAAWNNPQASNSATPPWVFVSSSTGAIQLTGIEVANKGIFFSLTIPMFAL